MDIKTAKEKLETELSVLTKELETIGRKNPANRADWEATGGELDSMPADQNEVADTIEEYETNTAILKQLETRFNNVKDALKRIEDGTYGKCRICGKEIEKDRLEANPAAETCTEHMGE